MATMTPRLRRAARVVVLDEQDRVLLLRYDGHGGFWALPGGSLEDGETYPQAARRELREELGAHDVTLGPHIAVRTSEHPVAGQPTRQVERYYLTHITTSQLAAGDPTQPDEIQAHRWWTAAELHTTDQTVFPAGLADLLDTIRAGRIPPHPSNSPAD